MRGTADEGIDRAATRTHTSKCGDQKYPQRWPAAAGLTAFQVLNRLGLKAGETVLIHGGSGGSGGEGSLGIQIAVALGARVTATASERNHKFLRSLGA